MKTLPQLNGDVEGASAGGGGEGGGAYGGVSRDNIDVCCVCARSGV